MSDMADIIEEIRDERVGQRNREGWDNAHDDEHTDGSLAFAAAAYAMGATVPDSDPKRVEKIRRPPIAWPWGEEWWKPKNQRRDLIRAAALIVAEIERLDRQAEIFNVKSAT